MSLLVPMVISLTDNEAGFAESSGWMGMGADNGDTGPGTAYTMGLQ